MERTRRGSPTSAVPAQDRLEGSLELVSALPRQLDQRQFVRLPVQARARIRIGKRAYAGYIEEISEGGARIVTLTPIRGAGPVVVQVPDLEPLNGELRWFAGRVAGIRFRLKLDAIVMHHWLSLRIRKAA